MHSNAQTHAREHFFINTKEPGVPPPCVRRCCKLVVDTEPPYLRPSSDPHQSVFEFSCYPYMPRWKELRKCVGVLMSMRPIKFAHTNAQLTESLLLISVLSLPKRQQPPRGLCCEQKLTCSMFLILRANFANFRW